MAYETAVLKQLEAYTAKHLSRMGGVSPHIRLTHYPQCRVDVHANRGRFEVVQRVELAESPVKCAFCGVCHLSVHISTIIHNSTLRCPAGVYLSMSRHSAATSGLASDAPGPPLRSVRCRDRDGPMDT